MVLQDDEERAGHGRSVAVGCLTMLAITVGGAFLGLIIGTIIGQATESLLGAGAVALLGFAIGAVMAPVIAWALWPGLRQRFASRNANPY